MNIKMLCLGALAVTMAGGAAFAASDTTALDNPETMKPFYSDSEMKTLVPETDFEAAWMKMTEDNKTKIVRECSEEDVVKAHEDFCAMSRKFGEATPSNQN